MNSKTSLTQPVARRPGRPAVDRREEILDAAQRLYGEIGFDKTTIADIARDLGMSPANLYRSFPNRQAIDEAIAARLLSGIEVRAWVEARKIRSVRESLPALSLAVLDETRLRLISEQRANHLCIVATRERWPVIAAYLQSLRGAVRHIIMDGQKSGELSQGDPEVLADTVFAAMTQVWHPQMIEAFAHEDLPATCERLSALLIDGMKK